MPPRSSPLTFLLLSALVRLQSNACVLCIDRDVPIGTRDEAIPLGVRRNPLLTPVEPAGFVAFQRRCHPAITHGDASLKLRDTSLTSGSFGRAPNLTV